MKIDKLKELENRINSEIEIIEDIREQLLKEQAIFNKDYHNLINNISVNITSLLKFLFEIEKSKRNML